ncbi:MAG: hypothetical protein Q4E11_02755 [Corynebacterium sp.]|uniref:hypothetical protein n=1 Tax=Corynebacterium sp. TaxID=1720 RepID=UPI0026DC7D21|nr:hypothetical protein [Corynebacterium sp.]MDO5029488.1 hypothetical protein [Corynebacterium sp.]
MNKAERSSSADTSTDNQPHPPEKSGEMPTAESVVGTAEKSGSENLEVDNTSTQESSNPYYLPKQTFGRRLDLSANQWWPFIGVIVLVQIIARVMVMTTHGFYWDDFIILGDLYDHSLFSKDYLLQDHDGHLAPLSFLVQGIFHTIAPWNWWLPAISMLLMTVVTTVASSRLFELITGRTLVSMFLIALVAWTPLMLPTDTWWSAAVNAQPFHLIFIIFMIVSIRTTVRRSYGPRPWESIGLFLLLLVALGFFEKSLAIAPISLMVVVTIAYMERSSILQTLRRGLTIWIPTMLLTGGWALLYYVGTAKSKSYIAEQLQPELFFNGLGQVFAGMIGGPTVWQRWAPGQPFAYAPSSLIALGGITLLILSATLIGRDYRGWAPWTLSAAYLFATLLAITAFRSGANTSGLLAHTLHYYADVALIAAVCIAISLAGTPPESDAPAPLPARTHMLIWAFGLALSITSTISVFTYRDAWSDDTNMEWLSTTQASLSQLREEADAAGPAKAIDYNLIDQPVPFEILVPVAAPMNMYSRVFDGVDDRPPFARVTGHPRMFDAKGTLIDAKVSEITRVQSGDVDKCGHQITVGPDGTASEDIGLENIIKLGDWVLEFPATASEDMDVRLSLPNPFETAEQTRAGSTVVEMNNELRPRYVYLNGGGNTLHIDVEKATPGATLCVGTGAIGPLVPANR